MAIVRAKQVREMSSEDYSKKMGDIRLELAKERGKVAVGSPADNPGKIKALKRAIARMITIKKEKQKK